MAGDVLTIEFEGDANDHGDVRLDDFIDQLRIIKSALKETERIVTDSTDSKIFYKVVDLSHSSPYRVRLQGIARKTMYEYVPRRVFRKMTTSLRMIQHRNRIPDDFDYTAIEAYKQLAQPMKRHLARVKITTDEKPQPVVLNDELDTKLEKLMGRDQSERGSITGTMEAFNIHNARNRFYLYPKIGPQRITCRFSNEQKDKILSAAGKYIRVEGWLVYKPSEKFPHFINVIDIDNLSERPATSISDLRGSPSESQSEETSEKFIRDLRDANW